MRGQNVDRRYSAILSKIGTPIPVEEERAVIIAAKAGNKAARDRLILANTGMALRLANSYTKTGVPVEDLFHAALEGAILAIGKFDVRKNFRFSTYATHWMRSSIVRQIQNCELPMRASKSEAVSLKHLCDVGKKFRSTEDAAHGPATAHGNSVTFADTLRAPERRLEEELDRLQLSADVRRALAFLRRTMNAMEVEILDRRLMPEEPETLQQIANRHDCSREWVRLVEKGLKRRLQVVLAPIEARRAA